MRKNVLNVRLWKQNVSETFNLLVKDKILFNIHENSFRMSLPFLIETFVATITSWIYRSSYTSYDRKKVQLRKVRHILTTIYIRDRHVLVVRNMYTSTLLIIDNSQYCFGKLIEFFKNEEMGISSLSIFVSFHITFVNSSLSFLPSLVMIFRLLLF